ncbi:MAG: phospholipase D-like domain-containing protein [Caulobacter sp.]|nr:phospholipase D-like domain-containing protein [Caulobacter sp.]
MTAETSLLRDGDTCWRTATANGMAFLVDGAEYFTAVKAAVLSARQSIWLLAWVFDPLTRLQPDQIERSGDPETADRLGLLLRRTAALNPAVDVRVLAWDMPFPLNASQAFAPQRAVAEFLGSRVKFRLDSSLPASACHHQKVLIIDGRLAFVSGGDLGADRWDTCDHADDDRHRRLPNLRRYPARHDVSVMLEGPAARDCAALFADRWSNAGGGRLTPPDPDYTVDSPWPAFISPHLTNQTVSLVRTQPAWRETTEVLEGLKLHLAAIASARRLIYLENQYLTAPTIVEALARRLAEPDGPEIVAIGPAVSPSFFDRLAMDSARIAAIDALEAADRHDRFQAWSARTRADEPIIVHSKVTIIDDDFLRIGSANLNNRSGGLDTECDLAFEARPGAAGDAARRAIAAFRDQLVSHYLGRSLADTQAAIADTDSLAAAVDRLDGSPRRLRPVTIRPLGPIESFISTWSLGDPTSPSDAWRPWLRRRHLRAQQAMIAPPKSPAPPPAADDPTPPATADQTATQPPSR